MKATTKTFDINSWKVGDKVRIRNYDYSTGKAVPMISKAYGYVREVSEFRGVVVFWPLTKKETCHDVDIVPA